MVTSRGNHRLDGLALDGSPRLGLATRRAALQQELSYSRRVDYELAKSLMDAGFPQIEKVVRSVRQTSLSGELAIVSMYPPSKNS
jgi:hypothetical protein